VRSATCWLADDDVLLREGLASLLDRSGFEVVGQAGNGVELLALARSARPELAVIAIRMPPGMPPRAWRQRG
jgi:DNA-binding NarL/FixJ family response regulator